MFKIVLVDDEKWILESLKGTVDWDGHGFRIAGEAYNGIEAFELISRVRPDIAFLDIRMPGMNGIELIRRLQEAEIPVHCIVASGYAEFEYAKQAMQYGAAGYCLKPFKRDEIMELLMAAKKKIVQADHALRHELLQAIYEQDAEDSASAAEIGRLLEKLNFRPGRAGEREEGMFAVVVQGGGHPFAEGPAAIPLRIGRGKTAYLLKERDRPEVQSLLESRLPPQTRGAGIGGVFHGVSLLRERIEAASEASYRYFTAEGRKLGEAEPVPQRRTELTPEALRLLDEGTQQKDGALVRQGLDRLLPLFRSGEYTIRHALRLYNVMLSFAYRTAGDYTEQYMSDYDQLAGVFGNVSEMCDELYGLIESSFVPAGAEAADSRGEETFRQIVRYVNEHFQSDVSIQDISKKFYIHPNYVSHLFKKELRVNFTKYLTGIRMERACELLRGTSLTVSEIAEQVGYHDYFYFAKLFKKQTGKTPTAYRNGS